ncbi:hypothetical protein SAMN05216480_101314 [Pustulibacterium marinum]|uniref:Uncharacterized protein n=1 Tax=Pustulibacterium marinum TaxID=1224947 RepID=A0A1I7EVQ5_9FLAO|nr:hypothetical protein [Pustulibacterium marinum]SFU28030.1 hypothetical protein SAMN05216480_101314 [Pustulibacterium marinum]
MKTISTTKNLFFCLVLSFFFSGFSQTKEQQFIEAHDAKTGEENLAVYNGSVHINKDVVQENESRYLYDEYHNCTVFYLGQTFYNIKCKYDLVEDKLVILPFNSNSTIGINAITMAVDSFYMADNSQKFINIDQAAFSAEKDGFYEILVANDGISLFGKHSKKKFQRIIDRKTFDVFQERTDFYVGYQEKLIEVSNRKSIVKLFPDKEEEINSYFKSQKQLQKKDFSLFLKKLFLQISAS